MRNVASFRGRVRLNVPETDFTLTCDAQTSGGLLIALGSDQAGAFETRMRESGLFYAKVGVLTAESGRITLNA